MSDKIVEMFNKSQAVVPVELKNGTTVYVPPRGKLKDVKIENLDKIRRFFMVKQDLTEVGEKPEVKRQPLNEPAPKVEEAPKRRGRKPKVQINEEETRT